MCGIDCKRRRLVLQLQSAEVSRPAALYEAGRSVLMLRKGSKIPRIELNTVHLYQQYSLFMPSTLQYTWRGDYCECVRPAQFPVLTEARASSLLEQHPRYVPHRDRTGYKKVIRFAKKCTRLQETRSNISWESYNIAIVWEVFEDGEFGKRLNEREMK